MGWTAYYQILRERPLDDGELVALADYIEASNDPDWECEGFFLDVTRDARADRVLGSGFTKLPMNLDESEDHQRLCDVLTALPTVIPGVEVRVSDDFECFGWDDDAQAVTMESIPNVIVELSQADRGLFAPPNTLVGPRATEVAAATDLPRSLVALARAASDVALAALATVPPLELALAGLAVYDDIRRAKVWDAVSAALADVADVAPLVEPFLAIWNAPRGVYWYGDMPFPDALRDRLARVPAVEAQLLADVAIGVAGTESELAHKRAGHAARMLGRSGSTAATLALVEGARALRDTMMTSDQRYQTHAGIHDGLVALDRPEAVATLLFDLGTKHRTATREGLRCIAKHAAARASPLLAYMAAHGTLLDDVVAALQLIGDPIAVATLRALCTLPIPAEQTRAADALRALGIEPPALAGAVAPETQVVHGSLAVRDWVRRELDPALDPTRLLSAVAAVAFGRALARKFDDGYSHWQTLELLPEPFRKAELATQLAWIHGDGARALPPQTIWPSITPILAGQLADLVARVPPPWPTIDEETAVALLAEEAAIIAALRSGTTVPTTTRVVTLVPLPAPATGIGPSPEEIAAADAQIDELLTMLARDRIPAAEAIARTRLPRDLATMSRWDRESALRKRLLELDHAALGRRLLARMPELHEGAGLKDLCDATFPDAVRDPELAQRIGELWDESHTWASASRLGDYFASIVATPEVFTRVLDEIAAPSDTQPTSRRTGFAFELLSIAGERRALAIDALVARLRTDRGRPREIVGWRSDAYRALRRLRDDELVATAILELAELASFDRGTSLVEAIAAAGARVVPVLERAIDLPKLGFDAARELCKLVGEDARVRYLAHPFWRVRIAAAEANRSWDQGKIERFAVWAAIDAAGIPMSEDERRYARPEGAAATATWDELARVHGKPVVLPPLAPPRESLAAPCADLRAWAIHTVDELVDPGDAVARVLADELDVAMVARGHARIGPRWNVWRAKVPELPGDRFSRLAWARSQDEVVLPPALTRVRDEGATAVAAELPGPCLTLSTAERAELEALERPIAERGELLLRDGVHWA